MPEPIWKKVSTSQILLPQDQSTYPRGPKSASIEIPFADPNLLSKSTSKFEHCWNKKNNFWKIYEGKSKRGISIDADSGPLRS